MITKVNQLGYRAGVEAKEVCPDREELAEWFWEYQHPNSLMKWSEVKTERVYLASKCYECADQIIKLCQGTGSATTSTSTSLRIKE